MSISMSNRVRYLGPESLTNNSNPAVLDTSLKTMMAGTSRLELSNPDGTTRATVVLAGHELDVAQP
ncbi:hypothetical protein LMG29542_00840 [Paraburkholderia humisilvae]|uniref:Uncharacterized protein n=1 Tax=Paraburkholderia humisilvae TaxID=627669 RepID=A0A6J5D8H2_9BURK|nr:hypothetical protein LMG29542_00840 [Paraburkholderia humisilvae]